MSGLVVPGPATIVGLDGRAAKARAPAFSEENEYKELHFRKLGDLNDIELLFNDILVLKYLRDKVSEHLVATPKTQLEDRYQGVCGLVLKLGPTAFQDDQHNKFPPICRTIQRGDWVLYRSSDGWDKNIQVVGEYDWAECRVIQDAHIRGRVKYPGRLL